MCYAHRRMLDPYAVRMWDVVYLPLKFGRESLGAVGL
jgi:hypothetical protein